MRRPSSCTSAWPRAISRELVHPQRCARRDLDRGLGPAAERGKDRVPPPLTGFRPPKEPPTPGRSGGSVGRAPPASNPWMAGPANAGRSGGRVGWRRPPRRPGRARGTLSWTERQGRRPLLTPDSDESTIPVPSVAHSPGCRPAVQDRVAPARARPLLRGSTGARSTTRCAKSRRSRPSRKPQLLLRTRGFRGTRPG